MSTSRKLENLSYDIRRRIVQHGVQHEIHNAGGFPFRTIPFQSSEERLAMTLVGHVPNCRHASRCRGSRAILKVVRPTRKIWANIHRREMNVHVKAARHDEETSTVDL
jgi:hypothetical protein